MVAAFESVWALGSLTAHLVVVQDPEVFNSQERRYVDLSFTEILQMQSIAVSESVAKLVVMCHSPKKDYLSKFL